MNFLQCDKINVKNSRTWIACNDNSRSEYFRAEFIKKFGGKFIKKGDTYFWKKRKSKKRPKKVKTEPQTVYLFSDIAGNTLEITSIKTYCKQNNMSNGALFDVVNGKRKSYKGLQFLSKTKLPLKDNLSDLSTDLLEKNDFSSNI
jgi:hypothetical protein